MKKKNETTVWLLIQLAASKQLHLPNVLVVTTLVVNQGKKKKKNPLWPGVNPCCTTKPQLVAFGASGLNPFVISCWNVTGFASNPPESFARE